MINTDDDLLIAYLYDKGEITDAEVRAYYGAHLDKFWRILKTTRALRYIYNYSLATRNVNVLTRLIAQRQKDLADLDKFVDELWDAKVATKLNEIRKYSGGRISVNDRVLELQKTRGGYRVVENTFDGWYMWLDKLDKKVVHTRDIPNAFGQPAPRERHGPYTVKLEHQDWAKIRSRLIEEIELFRGNGIDIELHINAMEKELKRAQKKQNASMAMFIATLINDACNTLADLIKMSAWY